MIMAALLALGMGEVGKKNHFHSQYGGEAFTERGIGNR